MKKFSDIFKYKVYPLFVFLFLIAVVLFWKSATREVASANQTDEISRIENYDIRADKTEAVQKALKNLSVESGADSSQISAAKSNLQSAVEEAKSAKNWTIEFNNILRTPEIIAADTGTNAKLLTAPNDENRADNLRRFIYENSALFGLDETQISQLETTADYTNPNGVLSFAHLAQKINGVPVFSGEIKAGFTKRGEIFRIVNNLAPALDYQNLNSNFGDAETAVSNAAKYINVNASENDLKRNAAASNDLKVTFERGQFADETTAEKFYFPVKFGAVRPAWRVLFWTKTDAFYVIVDAQDNNLLWRKNITDHQSLPATYNVYGNTTSMMQTADSPTPCTPGCNDPNNCPQPPVIARQNFTLVGNEPPNTFNNIGWIPDTGLPVRTPANPNITDGNNCEVGLDRDGTNGVDPDGHAVGNPFRVFSYDYTPTLENSSFTNSQLVPPNAAQSGAITHGFYLANRWHDETYKLGFTEAAGNFQHFNFGRGGAEGDRISFEVQDSSGTNSANFSTPADGGRGRMQMFLWTGADPDRDGALDSTVVIHELTHGLSSRLHGNLLGGQGGMMGEGWGDFYASAMLSEPTDNLCGTYPIGSYATYQVTPTFTASHYYGIRRFPTARISCLGPNGRPHNPLTFRHINSDCDTTIGTTTTAVISAFPRNPVFATSGNCSQVHNGGEIWSATLWEVRALLIEQHGAVEGNRRVLQYVTDGMKLAPLNPNMLQERDAIIAAASVSNSSDVQWVREGFRRRGMGFSAQVISPTQVIESFDTPNVRVIDPFSVSDAPGDGDGYPEAGENVLLSVTITNQSGQTATNVFVNVNGGPNVNVGTINNGQTVTAQIPYQVPANAPCASLHEVTINAGSNLGNQQPVVKRFRLDAPVGGPPVVATNAASISLTDGTSTAPAPASIYPSNVTVSGVIAGTVKITVTLNGYTHTFPGDNDFLLVGPGGQRFIPQSDQGSSGDINNITYTFDDGATSFLPAILTNGTFKPTADATADIFPAPAPAAPYNTPAPGGSATLTSTFGSSGSAMNGTWSLYITDDAGGDTGTISGGWTIKIESQDYVCPGDPPPTRARADFDGDGKTDMSVFRPSEGNWYMNRSTAGFAVTNWGLSGDVLVPGDYDGDGKADAAIMRGGDWYVLRSSNNTPLIVNWGLASDIAVPGDYDGDGKNDFAVFRPSEGNWYILRSSDNGVVIYNWGLNGDVPVVGDFDGDVKDDFSIYRNGVWYINASTTGIKIVSFGLSSDLPVTADYDGDFKDDIAVFRPSDGVWYIWNSSTNNVSYIQFGLNGDVPVPGDYDGDGKSDQAVYRNGIWYLNRSTAGFAAAQFGLANDKPIPKSYIP